MRIVIQFFRIDEGVDPYEGKYIFKYQTEVLDSYHAVDKKMYQIEFEKRLDRAF
ncbi:MAG: hypothetical protein ACOYVK_07695 [Bacillota bacterium]